MTRAPVQALPPAERRRRIALGLLRASAVAALLIAAYYLAPLSRLADVPLGLSLAVGLIALTAVASVQVKAVTRARHPGIRAVQALATTAPLFLLLFATSYFLMAQQRCRQLQHASPHPDQHALLHGHRLRHGRLRRHLGSERGRPALGRRADDPRPAHPGPGDPRLPRRRSGRPGTNERRVATRVHRNVSPRGRHAGRAVTAPRSWPE